jgi:hypothetical protein
MSDDWETQLEEETLNEQNQDKFANESEEIVKRQVSTTKVEKMEENVVESVKK